MPPILNRQRRRALERSDRNVTAEDLLLAYNELAKQNAETRAAIHGEVEAAFAAKWDAEFRELDDLRNETARMLRQLIDSGRLTQAEVNEVARG